jgi:glycosyltransferase involved in cell wall biosynthesis
MRLAVVNSTAPGTATLFAPFFAALAEDPDLELVVLEQTRREERARPERGPRLPSPYTVEPVPTYWYDRRHAAAQVMSGRYRELLVEADPDVIYVLGEPGYLSTYQVMRFARRRLPHARRCLLAAQNVYQRFPPPFPTLERYVLKGLDHAFALGSDHEQVLRQKGYRGPVTRLPLGVDTRVFAPRAEAGQELVASLPRPTIGYVGDFLAARNLPLLIDAVSRCRSRVGLLFVGDGPARGELEARAARLGLGSVCRFVGRVPHAAMPAYMNRIDVLVLPSKAVSNRCFGLFRIANAEQFGRVLVEAMACGTPVVGSSCGEIPWVIGEAGRVFPEGDTRALAAGLEELASDPALRRRLGQRARRRAESHYDWRVIATEFVAALRESGDRGQREEELVPVGTAAR